MTPQEQQMIDGLISRIRGTQLATKDAEAEQHIQQSLASFPDALYVLVQTVLVQQYGLEQAQSQIGELKQQVQTLQSQAEQSSQQPKPAAGGSFLSHLFGSGQPSQQPPAPQQSGYTPVNNPGYSQAYPAGGYPPPPPPAYPTQAYPNSGGMFGGGGGFLQGALQTAAGVAAGEMVFQGMEDLFHGFGGHEREFGGGNFGGGGETIVNNYYDDDRNNDRDNDRQFAGQDSRDDSNFYNPSSDASRDNDNDTSNNNDDASFDDNSNNDNSFDDSSNDSFVDDNS